VSTSASPRAAQYRAGRASDHHERRDEVTGPCQRRAPAAITVASLGTRGNTASSAATPRMSGYTHPDAVTTSTSDSNTGSLRADARDCGLQVGDRVLPDRRDHLRPLEQPRALLRSGPGPNIRILEDLGERPPLRVLA
jgi:hypothetical protein